ncbi:TPA: hypothetical protein ENS27_05020 [bacterium]|nr:hypothetical protein [bacterium]
MSKTVAYIRTSTDKQYIKNQRHEILKYENHEGMHIGEFICPNLCPKFSKLELTDD